MNKLNQSTKPSASFNQLAEVAVLAGITAERDEATNTLVTDFGFPDGRQQRVFAKTVDEGDAAVVRVFSPAATYRKGFFGGLSKRDARALLTLNSALKFARFSVMETSDEMVVMASMDLLLKTMDPEELSSALGSVSEAADTWEHYSGQGDRF